MNRQFERGYFLIILLLLAACSSVKRNTTENVVNQHPHIPLQETKKNDPPKEAEAPQSPLLDLNQEDAAVYHYSMGQAYSLNNDAAKAIEAYRATLAYDPDSPTVHTKLAAELAKTGQFVEALKHCESAIKLDKRFYDAYLLKAGIQVANSQYQAAVKTYRKVLKFDPSNKDALLYYGTTLAEMEKMGQAEQVLARLTRLKEKVSDLDRSIGFYYLAKVQYRRGRIPASERSLRQALKLQPAFAKAALFLSDIYISQRKINTAEKLLSESFRESEVVKVAERLVNLYLINQKYEAAAPLLEAIVEADERNDNVRMRLALIYWQLKWLDKSFEQFSRLHKQYKDSNEILYYLGELQLERKGPEAAMEYLEQITPDFDRFEDSVGRVGVLYRQQKQVDKGIDYLEDSIKKRPDIASFYTLLALLHEDNEDFKDGIEVLESGRHQFPTNERILYYLGFLYDRVGEKEKSFKLMQSILLFNPENASALNYIGYTLLEQKTDLDKAEEYLSKAIKIRPDDPYIMDSYGWLLFTKKRFGEAMVYLEKAAIAKPKEGVILEHLADTYMAMNMPRKAMAVYKQALQGKAELDGAFAGRVEEKLKGVITLIQGQDGERLPASNTEK